MRYEKIIKRDDKSRVEIDVEFYQSTYTGNPPSYKISIYICEPGKRKFHGIYRSDDWEYRKLSVPDREKWVLQQQLKYVTTEEILQAKLELWEKLKPTL